MLRERTKDMQVFIEVKEHMKNELPNYKLLKVTRRSNNPNESYLWMVVAKNETTK